MHSWNLLVCPKQRAHKGLGYRHQDLHVGSWLACSAHTVRYPPSWRPSSRTRPSDHTHSTHLKLVRTKTNVLLTTPKRPIRVSYRFLASSSTTPAPSPPPPAAAAAAPAASVPSASAAAAPASCCPAAAASSAARCSMSWNCCGVRWGAVCARGSARWRARGPSVTSSCARAQCSNQQSGKPIARQQGGWGSLIGG